MALNDIQIADLPLIQDVNDEDLIIIHDVSLDLTFKTTWDGLKNSIGTLVEGIVFPLGTPLEPSVAIGDYTSGIYGEDFGHFQIVTQGVDRIHVTPSGTQYLYNGNTVIGNLDEPCRWELDVYDTSTFHCDVLFKGDVEFEKEIEFDDIIVNGNAIIKGDVELGTDCNNDIIIHGEITADCDMDLAGNINIGGNAIIDGDLIAGGNIDLGTDCQNTINLHGDTTFDCDVTIDSDLTVGGNLVVEGNEIILGKPGGNCKPGDTNIDLNGDANIQCDTNIGGDLTVDGNATIGSGCNNSDITLDGSTTIECDLTVNGENIVIGNPGTGCSPGNVIDLNGDTTISCDLTANGDISLGTDCNNAIDLHGDITGDCNMTIAGPEIILGTPGGVCDTIDLNGEVTIECGTTIGGDLNVQGSVDLGSGNCSTTPINIHGITTIDCDLTVNGGEVNLGNPNNPCVSNNINLHGETNIDCDTNISGNLDVVGDSSLGTDCGNNIDVNGELLAHCNITGDRDLNLLGDANIGTDLIVDGNTTLGSGCSPTSNTIINSTLDVKCDTTIDGDLTVDGNIESVNGIFIGDGQGLINLNIPASMTFMGDIDVSQSPTSQGITNPKTGDFYLNNNGDGTTPAKNAHPDWVGISGVSVSLNRHVIYTVENKWILGSTMDVSGYVTLGTFQTITESKIFEKNITVGTNSSNIALFKSEIIGNENVRFDKDLVVKQNTRLGSGCTNTLLIDATTTALCDFTINGSLDVGGSVDITDDLVVGGNTTLGSGCGVSTLTIDSATSFKCGVDIGVPGSCTGMFNVYSPQTNHCDVIMRKDLLVEGDTEMEGNLEVDGNITGHSNLVIDENATIGSGCSNLTTLNSKLDVKCQANIDGNLTANGSVDLGSGGCTTTPINLHGETTIDCDLDVKQDTNIDGSLNVGGSVDLGSGTCDTTPINIHGVVNIDCNTNVGGNLQVDGNGNIDGNITGGGDLDISGSVDLGSGGCNTTPINLHGNTTIDCDLNVNGSVDLGNGVCNNTPINIHGETNIDCDTNIGGNIDVNGNGSIGGNLGVDGNITGGGNITIDGDVVLGKPGNCNQNIEINGDTTINCETTINEDLNVNGDINIKPGNVFDGQLKYKLIAGDYIITKVADNFYNNTAQRTFHVDGTTAATANKVAVRDGNADLLVRFIQNNHGRTERKTDDTFYSTRSDNFIRKNTAQGMRDSLDILTQGETDALIGKGTLTINGRNALDGSVVFSANEFTDKVINLDVKHDNVTIKRNVNDQLFVDTTNLGVGDGQINFNAGDGLSETGNNATANQTGDTTKTFNVQAANDSIDVGPGGISVNFNGTGAPVIGDGQINFNAGDGLDEDGDNATANQTGDTIKTFKVKAADDSINVGPGGISVNYNGTGAPVAGDGQINFNAGDGLSETGQNATANQTGDTIKTFNVQAANDSIDVGPGGISVNFNGTGAPVIGDGQINFNAGDGLKEIGNNATANQTGDTIKTFSIKRPSGGGGLDLDSIDGLSVKKVTLWGQDHDHNGNVSGDMTRVKSITGANAPLIIQANDGTAANVNWNLVLRGNEKGSNIIIGDTSRTGYIEFQSGQINCFRFVNRLSGTRAVLDFDSITGDRKYTFQDGIGTLAFLRDIKDSEITIKINGVAKSFTLNQSNNNTLNFGNVSGGGGGGGAPALVTLWGQEHDHTSDVSGDMIDVKSITGAATSLIIKPKDGNGNHDLVLKGNDQNSNVIIGDGSTNGSIQFYSGSPNGFKFFNSGGSRAILNFEELNTGNKFTFQNKTGILAHLDDISDETINIKINSTTKSFTLNGSTQTLDFGTISGGGGGGTPALVTLWGQPHDHTGDVSGDMTGVKSITGAATNLIIKPKDGNGNHDLVLKGNAEGSNVVIGDGSTNGSIQFYSALSNGFRFFNSTGIRAILNFENLSGGKTFTFQDSSGTLAHLDDISNETINIKINSITKSFTLNGSTETLDFGTISGGGGGTPASVTLWGQPHDHTSDVTGDMIDVKSITGAGTNLVIRPKNGSGTRNLVLKGNDDGSNINIGDTSLDGMVNFYSGNLNGFRFHNTNGKRATFNFENLNNADKKFTFQNKTGTLAHLDDISDETINIKINSITKSFTLNGSTETLDFGTISGGGGGAPASVTLWGQPHDHTSNVTGDMIDVKSITGASSDLLIKPKDGNGNHDLVLKGNAQNSNVVIGDGSTNGSIQFYSGSPNGFKFFNSTGIRAILNFENLSGGNTFTFQNKTGTIAHLDDISDKQISIKINGVTKDFTLNQNSDKSLDFGTIGGGGGAPPALVTLWGQPHDHTGDVSGDMTSVKSITGASSDLLIKPKDGNGNHDLVLKGNTDGSNVIIGDGSTSGFVQFYSGATTGGFRFFNSTGDRAIINFENLSVNRTFTFQDSSGTLAHLDDISDETITIDINGSAQTFTLNGSTKTLSFTVSSDVTSLWEEVTTSDGSTGIRPSSVNYTSVVPRGNVTSLGLPDKRWSDVWTNDLHLSNEGKTNDVDGTWGNWTIQEGEDELYLINNRSGKKFAFMLRPVN